MNLGGVHRKRHHRRHRCREECGDTKPGPDRRPRDDPRAESEDKTDGDEMEQGIMGRYRGDIENCEKHRRSKVSDRVALFPFSQRAECEHRLGAAIGADRQKARQGRDGTKAGEAEQKGAAELVTGMMQMPTNTAPSPNIGNRMLKSMSTKSRYTGSGSVAGSGRMRR